MNAMHCLALASLLALAGCATMDYSPATGGRRGTPRGAEPTAQQMNDAVTNALQLVLKDPDSVKQLEILSGPYSVSWYSGALNGNRTDEGWMICFRYNAKNSYGAYVGSKVDRVMVRNPAGTVYLVDDVNWPMVAMTC